MQTLQIIKGKQTEISLHELIYKQISRLNEANKKYCLELIMDLDADDRVIFLNAFMMAVSNLSTTNIAAA